MAQTLADDILYKIFLHLLPVTIDSRVKVDDQTFSPLNVSLVCRSWRSLVLSHPSLWSSIEIKYIPGLPSKLPRPVPYYLEKWLLHSSPALIDISLELCRVGSEDFDPEYHKILSLTLNECRRWGEIQIVINSISPEFNPESDSLKIFCTPSVTSINIAYRFVQAPRSPLVSLDLSDCTTVTGSSASRLSELIITSKSKWTFPPAHKTLHLPNVAVLRFRTDICDHLGDVFTVMLACPSLEALGISTHATPDPQPLETRTFAFPHLTQFAVSSKNIRSSRKFLERISCPSIVFFHYETRLSLDEPVEDQDTVATPHHFDLFTDFFSRSFAASHPTIKFLTLAFSQRSEADPPEFLRACARALERFLGVARSVIELELHGLYVDDELIKKMTIDDGQGGNRNEVLCPELMKLFIFSTKAFGLQTETLEDMLVSRWLPPFGHSLVAVVVKIPGFENFLDESERIKKCVGEGLQIEVL